MFSVMLLIFVFTAGTKAILTTKLWLAKVVPTSCFFNFLTRKPVTTRLSVRQLLFYLLPDIKKLRILTKN
jgi:hypothetical protein